MSDGDIDYSRFTFRELEEALAGINRQRYPKNYANLRAAYEQRVSTSAAHSHATATATDEASNKEPSEDLRGKFWGSRPLLGIVGVFCFWWAYDIFSHTNACPSGGKLIGDLVTATCENFGQTAAAGIPFFIGVVSVALAIRPRRQTEA